jgi:hypothetical protein
MSIKLMVLALAALPAVILAWQGHMGALGITDSALRAEAQKAVRYFSQDDPIPWFGPKTRDAAKALSEQDRAAAVREILGTVKAIVMSKPFMDAHAEYVKKEFKGVDHGIKVLSPEEKHKAMMAGGEAAIDDATKQMAVQMAQMVKQMPDMMLKPMFEEDMKSWERESKSNNAKSRAKGQKLYAGAKAIEGLVATDVEKFKNGYMVLKSIDMGGPDNLAAIQGGANQQQMEMEQENWNKHSLKGILRGRLSRIAKEAGTVDFAAQTVQQGNTRKFVNPVYERKSAAWKAMYRAGKAPTMAVAEFANAWLKEL